MIKLYDVNHAVEIIFDEDLIVNFENEFGKIADGANFESYIDKNNITLNQLASFLTRNTTDKYVI